jgi:hypothetical protein
MRNWPPSLWRLTYVAGGAVVLFGSFFITLWLTEPDVPKAVDNRSDTERLAAQHVSTYPELDDAAASAGLRFSRQLQGVVDGINRLNEHEVNMVGWLADPEGNETPLHILVFIQGAMVATAQTNGERPDVTKAIGLGFGAEKNVAFSFKFNCSPDVQPIVAGVGAKGQYMPFQSKKCP